MTGMDEFGFAKETAGGGTVVALRGPIDERSDLAAALSALAGETLTVNLKEVSRINSSGVRNWINAIKPLVTKFKIAFSECSRAIVDQLNMINNFFSSGEIVSFYAPYYCPDCDREFDALIDIGEHFKSAEEREAPEAPEFKCPRCGREGAEFAEDEDKYFSFLSHK